MFLVRTKKHGCWLKKLGRYKDDGFSHFDLTLQVTTCLEWRIINPSLQKDIQAIRGSQLFWSFSIKKLLILYGLKQLVPIPLFSCIRFSWSKAHRGSLSLSMYIIIYIYIFPGATNTSLKIQQLMCFSIYYVYTLMTTQGFCWGVSSDQMWPSLTHEPTLWPCHVGPGHHWAWFHSLEQGESGALWCHVPCYSTLARFSPLQHPWNDDDFDGESKGGWWVTLVASSKMDKSLRTIMVLHWWLRVGRWNCK